MQQIDEILQKFDLSIDKLQEVTRLLREDFDRGLSADPEIRGASPIKMLPTFVRALPDGAEEGDFLALDLGGTNFRVLLIQIHDREVHIESDIYRLNEELMTSDAATLFDYIADCIEIFMKKRGIKDRSLPLGFTFSFPVDQLSLTSGLLIRWTKGFSATGTEGEDVVMLLKQAMERKKVGLCAIVHSCLITLFLFILLKERTMEGKFKYHNYCSSCLSVTPPSRPPSLFFLPCLYVCPNTWCCWCCLLRSYYSTFSRTH